MRTSAWAREVAAAFAVFCLLYNVSFVAAPSASTGRVIILALAVWGGRRLHHGLAREASRQALWVCGFLVILAYAAVLWVTTGMVDATQFSRIVNFGLLALVAPVVIVATLCEDDPVRALRAVVAATMVQAVCIAIAYGSPAFREFTADLLVQGGNIPIAFGGQVAGFSNSAGAALSVAQAMGVFSATLLARRASTTSAVVLWFAAAVLIGLSPIVVGRTGVILSAVFIGSALLTAARPRHALTILVSGALCGTLLYVNREVIVERAEEFNPAIARTLVWSVGVFERLIDDPSVIELRQTPIPPLTAGTIVGTGIVSAGGVNASGHDSGYIQTYYALGAVAALAFYAGFTLLALSALARRRERLALLILLLALLVIEVKEPFLFKYAGPMTLFFALLATRRQPPAAQSAAIMQGE